MPTCFFLGLKVAHWTSEGLLLYKVALVRNRFHGALLQAFTSLYDLYDPPMRICNLILLIFSCTFHVAGPVTNFGFRAEI